MALLTLSQNQAVVDPAKLHNSEQLQDAFNVFNALSQDLVASYQNLQQQVADLSQELAAARHARLKTLTEKEQLANQLHSLLEALPGGIIVVDAEGLIVRRNRAASELLGEPLLNMVWMDIVARCFSATSDTPHERKLADGRYVNLSIQPLDQDGGQIILLTDVSEVRLLQDMVNHQKRLSAIGEMVAGLAHQIRTPLSAAMLYASHLGNPGLEAERQKRYAERLRERLHYLERQVNDMLIFARDGRLVMKKIPLTHLVEKISEATEQFLNQHKVRFQFNNQLANAEIHCNEDALVGAVSNLVTNAVQAMNGSGRLELELTRQADRLRISVSDDGPGIAAETVQRLFEPFFTTRTGGTGLGLAVVENVVASHNGRVWCESVPCHGANFNIELPFKQNENLLPGGVYQPDNRMGAL